jgi:hypothetical protein
MVDASSDFARMAKELRKKSEASWLGDPVTIAILVEMLIVMVLRT